MPGPKDVTWVLGKGASVKGHVVDEKGRPLAHMPVHVVGVFRSIGYTFWQVIDQEQFIVRTDSEGRFAYRGLGWGEFAVVARDKVRMGSVVFEIEAKETRTVTIRATVAPRLELRLVDPAGALPGRETARLPDQGPADDP